ncbi:helix-turn-helix domain-containing protein [Serratia marcescens]|uniref:helix-turn-helix domain-containing protein n=1 Tax=Serratia marcescens TaxID=615 RepID=UPI001E505E75|nr:helix-turn-helix domain-containing protein [Serratia marcescens]
MGARRAVKTPGWRWWKLSSDGHGAELPASRLCSSRSDARRERCIAAAPRVCRSCTIVLERLRGETVLQIAETLGYASPSNFIAMFRKAFGDPPARYFSASAGKGR